jgi:hypothetical protein
MRLVYAANVAVAGTVGALALFAPATASATVFGGTVPANESMRLVGCLWLAITALSVAVLFAPTSFSPVFLIQFIYKGLWLAVVAVPTAIAGRGAEVPWGMAAFFAVWVVLPLVIPWRRLFASR